MHIMIIMSQEETYKHTLKNANERLTSPRLILFRALLRHSPVSTVSLTELGRKNGIDPATTYRTLTLLRRLGIIEDIVAGGKRLVELSDDYTGHHHHFWCRKCGRLIDFDSKVVEVSLANVIKVMGASMSAHHIEIQGECGDCSTK
ncbi:MAG: transcriptional regulator, Fur family transcriptional regulator, ferric uptake regulator [Patescibacteria group bacterium]|jgi:Fe2+ or Zn2+ uptake regulation protein|nr:transcriptional regulator, Fur family transcriptional regulator, ferric uptake regulator [Patescibacteria group bacterium]